MAAPIGASKLASMSTTNPDCQLTWYMSYSCTKDSDLTAAIDSTAPPRAWRGTACSCNACAHRTRSGRDRQCQLALQSCQYCLICNDKNRRLQPSRCNQTPHNSLNSQSESQGKTITQATRHTFVVCGRTSNLKFQNARDLHPYCTSLDVEKTTIDRRSLPVTRKT